jgi:hypothetical protein
VIEEDYTEFVVMGHVVSGYQESIQLSGAYATRQTKLKKRKETRATGWVK